MEHAAIAVVMRCLHLGGMALVVGGMAFMSLCLGPATRLLDEDFRVRLTGLAQRLFERVVLAGIVGLIVSGAYNWWRLAPAYKAMGPAGNALIGAKVLLAALLFAVAGARIVGWLPRNRFWHMFNLHLAALITLLAVILHYLRSAAAG